VLWDFHDILTMLFEFYSATDGGSIARMGFNGWAKFTHDFNIASKRSKFCKRADLDRLFIVIDAAAAKLHRETLAAAESSGGAKKRKKPKGVMDEMAAYACMAEAKVWTRVEFVAAIVHVAISRYVLQGDLTDVSEAVHCLIARLIEPRLDPLVFCDRNIFRRRCYAPPVNGVVVVNESSLKAIFSAISPLDSYDAKTLLSLSEWLKWLDALEFIGEDVSLRDAILCFTWSITVVIDGSSKTGSLKEQNLPYEGFLEALCRMAMLKSLPTDAEIANAGFADAGQYMNHLKIKDEEAYMKLMSERATPWGHEPPQPIERQVYHMIAIIIRTMEEGSDGTDDMVLTQREANDWVRRALGSDKSKR